jgi:ABC-type Fe3+/spermidine/putrescine transport system ATPase subunit
MSMSDRIAILNRGRIDQVGPPGEVYERPANPFAGRFLGEANLIEGTLMRHGGEIARLVLSCGQELRAPRGRNCSDEDRAMLFIRPERIEIMLGANAGGGPRDNALAGRIRRCAFLGNILRYAVDIDGTAPVTVDLQNAVGVAPLPAGTPVVLRWPVADSLILPAEP